MTDETLWAVIFNGHIHTPDDRVRLLFKTKREAEAHRQTLGFPGATKVHRVHVSIVEK